MEGVIEVPAISVRIPVNDTDKRHAVTIEEDDGMRIVVYFLGVSTVEDDREEQLKWINVGFELGERFDFTREEAARGEIELERIPVPLDPMTVQRVAANYPLYVRFAREALVFNTGGMAESMKMLRDQGRTRRGLTNDFYRLVAAEYETRRRAGGHAVKEMAEAHWVDKSTVSRWIKAARKRGYITEPDNG